MNIKFGNLHPEEFAEQVGTEFTAEELAELLLVWSTRAVLTGPDQFHIFDDPAITIHVGFEDCRAMAIFMAANDRKTFNRAVTFHLDDAWREA